MSLSDWDAWGSIVAGAIAIIGGGYATFRYFNHKITFLNPIKACYLIPKSSYPLRQFNGAPANELRPRELIIGVGQYCLMHILTTKTNIEIDSLVLSFEGPDVNKPIIDAPDNPFIVESTKHSGFKYRKDWWGQMYPYSNEPGQRYWFKSNSLVTGHKITTTGEWKGKSCITVPIRNEKPYLMKLDLQVSESRDEDEIPFLKIQQPN